MDYDLEGMHCGACAARIERTLGKLPGGAGATVNYATKRARVPESVTPDTVMAAVSKLGYSAQPTVSESATESPEEHGERQRLVVSALLGAPVFVLGMAHVDFPGNGILQAILTTLVLVGPGRGFFFRAAKLLRTGAVNMDTLVALGVGAAYLVSLTMVRDGAHAFYFETVVVIVTLILFGRYLEDKARRGTQAAVRRLAGLQAKTARRVVEGGKEEEVPVASLRVGDLVVVRAGEKAPADGVAHEGESIFDESMITGESEPARRRAGEMVIGATTNVGKGRMVVRVTRVGSDTTLAKIVSLVEDAQASKAQAQRLADRAAQYFVPAVLVIALGTFVVHWLVLGAAVFAALTPAVAVLVIACPCALGLATPTAILAGTGRAAEELILIRSAPGLERTEGLTTVVVDKTGTLTEGHPSVVEAFFERDLDPSTVLTAVHAAESASQHPLAMAVVAYAEAQEAPTAKLISSIEHAGDGIEAVVEMSGVPVVVRAGRIAWLAEEGISIPEAWRAAESEARGQVFAAIDMRAALRLTVEDKIRSSAPNAVKELEALGVRLVMATGDRLQTARAVAAQLGITDVRAEQRPEDKVRLIKDLQAAGERVAMVGDGINDAPALAAADVGIAVGAGADVALDAAAIVIPHGDLAKVVRAITLSRRTMGVIRQNLGWAFLYNVLAVPVAAVGQLSPMIAAGAMALSSVSVVANSLRLRKRTV